MIDGFETERLSVRHWRERVSGVTGRAALETALRSILSPAVLAPLPPPMRLGPGDAGLGDWIDDRIAEADVYTVTERRRRDPIGLLILSRPEADTPETTLHIGYLLAERAWGRGLATDLVAGLVSAMRTGPQVRLVGGVGRDNPASARVLEKAGFRAVAGPDGDGTTLYTRRVGRGA